jgi:hypothetical protein
VDVRHRIVPQLDLLPPEAIAAAARAVLAGAPAAPRAPTSARGPVTR